MIILALFRTLRLVPQYLGAIAKEWTNLLFGEGVLAVVFLIWWALGSPPLVLIFLSAALVAGYYAWRPLYLRLTPKLKLEQIQVTPTPSTGDPMVVIHVIPECLTDVPVEACRGHLLRVWRGKGNVWEPTAMDEPLDLNWSIYDDPNPRPLFPGVPTRLNLCGMSRRGIGLMSSRLLMRWGDIFSEGIVFRFDVRVTANDCPPVDAFVTVGKGPAWNQPRVSISKNSDATLNALK
jgi:hypothetical protein